MKKVHKIFIFLMALFIAQKAFCYDFRTVNSLNKDIPGIFSLNFSHGLEPGKTLEDDFKQKYYFLMPEKKSSMEYESIYVLDKKYLEPLSDYNKVVFIFQNGLLNTMSLYPKDLEIGRVLKLYGNQVKIRPAVGSYKFYEYSNFILLVNTKDKKVKSIGIISSI